MPAAQSACRSCRSARPWRSTPLSLFAPIDRWLAPAPAPGKVAWIGEHIFAHRGLHRPDVDEAGVPENSPGAFAAAIAGGYGIECDIQRSADGQAMVFHDWNLRWA